MSDDIASLRINIRSLEAQVAQQRLDGLTRSGSRAETSTNSLTKAFVKFAGPAALAAGAVYGLSQIVSVTREFDVLNAQLITATGSAENAGRAFEAIQQFATETPYDLAQATEGFTKLVNLGLTPSEKALKSYGDTASAMGKDLIQLVEAVADASTGEFERLKEFGIKTKKNGDDIAFTFRGVTTSVKNNSEEIESYLIALGENNFAGAMEQRIATLDGAFSNFGDAWNKMVLTISQTGIGDAIEDGVRLGTEALEEMTTLVASGQLQGYLSAIAGQFSGFGGAAADAFDYISGIWADVPSEWKTNAGLAVDAFINALKHLPIEVESLIKLAAVELAVFVDYAGIYGKLAVDAMFAYFGAGVERAKVYGKAIAEALDPRTDYDLDGELAKIDARFTTTTDTALAAARNRAEVSAQVRRDVINGIIDERRAAIDSFDVQIEKADVLRSSWDEIQLAKKNATGDRLAEFKITPDKSESAAPTLSKSEEKIAKRAQKEFDDLVESLRSEEEAIQESYNNRLDIILANTEEGSKAQRNLKAKLDSEFSESVLEGFEASSSDQFQTEIDILESQYEAKRAIILENTALTEEQRTELEMQLTRSRNDQVQSLEQQRIQMTLQSSAQLFSGLASLTASAGAEQSGVYKVMFAASKAFAVADSIVSIQQGIAAASKLGFPQNLPAIANIVSSTAGVISTIQGTDLNFAGAYDKGGDIPQGSFGLVGEYGPELIKGPVNVTGREKTANLLRNSSSESSTQSGSTTLQVTQHITVTGNGDKALQTAMTQAAAKGTQDAYKLISNDLKSNRGVSKYVARRA